MAKIITQNSLFNYEEIERLGDLERLRLALEGINDEELMRKLERKRKNGRDDYPVRVMWNLVIAMKVFGHDSVSSFIRECNRNSQLRHACGLFDYVNRTNLVPPARVFTGFLKRLSEFQDEVNSIFQKQVNFLYANIEGFGETLAGDGKIINSYAKNKPKEAVANPDLRSEIDAEYTIKKYNYTTEDGKKHEKKSTYYGFKAHIICDVNTELPISFIVTKANYSERAAMKEMIKDFKNYQKDIAKYLLLDRGYDSVELIRYLKSKDINPVVDIRNMWKDNEKTKQYKNTNLVYNAKGEVFYVNDACVEIKMKYEGFDKQKNCLRYSHEGKVYKIYISYDERIFLPIARDSNKFKRLYKGRTTVERLNGRLDRDYKFEKHFIRGLKKMNLMVTLSLIVMNGMAVGKIKNNISSIRSLVTAA
jgi:hypothetical protein